VDGETAGVDTVGVEVVGVEAAGVDTEGVFGVDPDGVALTFGLPTTFTLGFDGVCCVPDAPLPEGPDVTMGLD